jgi:hypothetical protein
LHDCRPHRLDCGGCARARATFSSYGHAPYYKTVHDWLGVESRALQVFVKNRVLKI